VHPGYGALEVAGPVDSWLPAATDGNGCRRMRQWKAVAVVRTR